MFTCSHVHVHVHVLILFFKSERILKESVNFFFISTTKMSKIEKGFNSTNLLFGGGCKPVPINAPPHFDLMPSLIQKPIFFFCGG